MSFFMVGGIIVKNLGPKVNIPSFKRVGALSYVSRMLPNSVRTALACLTTSFSQVGLKFWIRRLVLEELRNCRFGKHKRLKLEVDTVRFSTRRISIGSVLKQEMFSNDKVEGEMA
ncbi:hypothetical protein GBA52_003998 [Prunus armeniaca]|nr:hypothetical protein GBA52_003998 [Prunus armeniaca]